MNAKRIVAVTLVVLVLSGVVLPAGLAFLAVQSQPLVVHVDDLTPERARQARDLGSRLKDDFLRGQQPRDIVLGADELNGLASLAARAMPRLQGRVNVTPWAVLSALTVTLPRNPFGTYLNLSFVVNPSDHGLDIAEARVGSLTLPRSIAKPLGRAALDLALGDGNGTALVGMVRSVSVADGKVVVGFKPLADFQARLESIRQRFRLAREEAVTLGDAALTRAYCEELLRMAESADPERPTSLASYMGPLFDEARRRSRGGSAVEQNRAALMALAIYYGSDKFQELTGPVLTEEMKRRRPHTGEVTLAQRKDSRLHFIYSAALKLAADSGFSIAIGEFKELTDSTPHGSGFSFADLAADRAGIWFAREATHDEASAARVQALLAGDGSEAVFFPVIGDLPEGLPEQEFARQYGGVDAPAYRAMVAGIEGRLRELPLYRDATDLSEP